MVKASTEDLRLLASNPRATLAAWERYRSLVSSAMRFYPQAYQFAPATLSPTSVVSKMRDAIRGKIAFDFPGDPETELVRDWYAKVILKVIDGKVFIGPREQAKVRPEVRAKDEGGSMLTFGQLAPDELAALFLLLSRGKLSGPVRLTKIARGSELPDIPNVEAIPQPDGSLLLL